MTLCNSWSVVKDLGAIRYGKPLPCRSWNCDYCAPNRRSQLMALAASGSPTRFLTLTVNPTFGADPEARLKALARAWRIVVQRLRRKYAEKPIEYLAVVEETKLGEPHLHILLRAPYLPQALLSRWMGEIINSPIVDIRAVRGVREVIRYIAKYISKAPHQFGHAKRYWHSSAWDEGKEEYNDRRIRPDVAWSIVREDLSVLARAWTMEGFACRAEGRNGIIGILTGYVPSFMGGP